VRKGLAPFHAQGFTNRSVGGDATLLVSRSAAIGEGTRYASGKDHPLSLVLRQLERRLLFDASNGSGQMPGDYC
jgi:hypothetical protein